MEWDNHLHIAFCISEFFIIYHKDHIDQYYDDHRVPNYKEHNNSLYYKASQSQYLFYDNKSKPEPDSLHYNHPHKVTHNMNLHLLLKSLLVIFAYLQYKFYHLWPQQLQMPSMSHIHFDL